MATHRPYLVSRILACFVLLLCSYPSMSTGEDSERKKCRAFGMGSFKPEETDEDRMPVCCWYADATCCVFNGQLNPAVNYKTMYGNFPSNAQDRDIPNSCYAILADIACYACSPNTHDFFNFHDDDDDQFFSFEVCNARCSEIWNECGEFLGVDDEKEFCSSSGFGEGVRHIFGSRAFPLVRFFIDDDEGEDDRCFHGDPVDHILSFLGTSCLPPLHNPSPLGPPPPPPPPSPSIAD